MKVDLTRLDKEFMTEMLIKTYGVEMDAETIDYHICDSFVKIQSDGYFISVWGFGVPQFAYRDFNLGVISAIINRMKTCDNCKYWTEKTDNMGKCDLSLICVDGENFDISGKQIDRKFDEEEKSVSLELDSSVYEYQVEQDNYKDPLELSDIFSAIQVWTGKDFSCSNHKFKEEK